MDSYIFEFFVFRVVCVKIPASWGACFLHPQCRPGKENREGQVGVMQEKEGKASRKSTPM